MGKKATRRESTIQAAIEVFSKNSFQNFNISQGGEFDVAYIGSEDRGEKECEGHS